MDELRDDVHDGAAYNGPPHCQRCGYDIRRSRADDATRCPECGTGFAEQPRLARLKSRFRWTLAALGGAWAAISFSGALPTDEFGLPSMPLGILVPIGLISIPVLSVACVDAWWALKVREGSRSPLIPLAVGLALLLMALSIGGCWSVRELIY